MGRYYLESLRRIEHQWKDWLGVESILEDLLLGKPGPFMMYVPVIIDCLELHAPFQKVCVVDVYFPIYDEFLVPTASSEYSMLV